MVIFHCCALNVFQPFHMVSKLVLSTRGRPYRSNIQLLSPSFLMVNGCRLTFSFGQFSDVIADKKIASIRKMSRRTI